MTFLRLTPLFLLLAACGSTSTSSSPTDTGTSTDTGGGVDTGADGGGATIDQACGDLAKARCAKLEACSAFLMKVRNGDQATCETREKAACIAALSASGTSAAPASAGVCASAITAATCATFFGNTPIPACATKPGAGAIGAACAFSGQCESTFCAVLRGSSCGKCAAVPKVGDSCSTTTEGGEGCGPTLHCGKSGTCTAFVASGGACDKDSVCENGMACVTAKGAAKGTCQAFAATEGATCDFRTETAPSCDRSLGLWCPTAGKCAKVVNFAKSGEPCGLIDATTYATCTFGSSCDVPTGGAGKGTCVGPSAPGGPCDISGGGASCVTGGRCVTSGDGGTTGTCVTTDASTCK